MCRVVIEESRKQPPEMSHGLSPVSSLAPGDLATREFHPHQYVKVNVSPTKTEIGIVVSADENTAVVATRYGYNITVKTTQLQRAFLLVLDLNGVLGARQKKTLFERRPHLETFLKFALTNFVVSVWTSCEERNGKQIIEDLLEDDRDRLLFTFFRGDCTPNPTVDRPFGTVKNLQRIFDKWPESFHAVNTVIVDDSPDKCSHPDIALCPPAFSGIAEQPEDDGLLHTIDVLTRVLATDSLDPLIEAAEERRQRVAAQAPPPAVPCASVSSSSPTKAVDIMRILKDKQVLCCQSSFGKCTFGSKCKFAHLDDGFLPCSRGTRCSRHSDRAHQRDDDSNPSNNFAAMLLARLSRQDGVPSENANHLQHDLSRAESIPPTYVRESGDSAGASVVQLLQNAPRKLL